MTVASSAWPIVLPARLDRGVVQLSVKRLAAEMKGRKDGPLMVTFERAHATRSAAQNAWYWGKILRLVDDHTGQSVDDLHEFFKLKFNPKRLILTDKDGVIVGEERIGQTTTRLNKITFSEYCEQCRLWALEELGVVVPDPDPNWKQRPEEVVGA